MVKQASCCLHQVVLLLSLLAALGASTGKPDAVRSKTSACKELAMPRLPDRIRPTNYKLDVLTNLDDFSFKGSVQIYLEIGPNEGVNSVDEAREQDFGHSDRELQTRVGDLMRSKVNEFRHFLDNAFEHKSDRAQVSANQIALHADASLVITSARYMELDADGKTENYNEVVNVCHNENYDLLVVTLKRDLHDGTRGRLHLSFAGPIRDDKRGFYRSSYLTLDGELRHAAATQFEPTDARRAFPCFDEPNFKATFELTLVHASDRIALSNTPTVHEEDIELSSDGWLETGEIVETTPSTSLHLVRFKRTPPMSTYLLAWVVGEFEHLECKASNNRIKIRVQTEPGRREQGRFALETACRAVEKLEDYFGIKLPLKKIDMVSLNDFAAGAMENWGLITFSDESFLVDEQHTSPSRKAHVAAVVIHELSHQWFGNLVTMHWWNDLWLNEGFATWAEYNMTQALFPDYKMDYEFVLKAHIPGLLNDESTTARSIAPKSLSDDTNYADLFDAIAYEKSASMIRLLNYEHLGPALFKSAIQLYLNKHLYGNTQTKDLWGAMESVGSQSVQKIMDSWVSQPGHPVVKVAMKPNTNELSLEQERITSNPTGLSKQEQRQQWIIPISVIVSDGSKQLEEVKVTMNGKYARLKLPSWFDPSEESGHWFKVNPNFAGFYRVKYQMDLMRLLRKPIESRTLSPIDRTEVISDAVALFGTKRISCDEFLEVLSWYSHEDSGLVLEVVVDSFQKLREIFTHNKISEKVHAFGRKLFEQVYQKFGFNIDANMGPIDQSGRVSALKKLIELNHYKATHDAVEMFNTNIAPVLRPAVYMAVARHGSDDLYKRLFKMFESTSSREERNRLVAAMFQATDSQRLETAWNWFKSPDIRVESKLTVLQNTLDTKQGRRFVRHLFKYEREDLQALDTHNSMAHLASNLCIAMGSDSLPELNEFFSKIRLFNAWGYWFKVISGEFIRRDLIQAHGGERMIEMLEHYSEASQSN